jgi:hypothetical protein
MDLSPADLDHLRRIGQEVLRTWHTQPQPQPLTDRITILVDRLLDAGRRDEARVLFDAMATIRSIYAGTPATMDLAGAAQLLAEAAARVHLAAVRAR